MKSLKGDLLLQRLAENTSGKLYTRLYNVIRMTILDGSLSPATRLPPSRDLAQELDVSRNTVIKVYDQLLAEGYIVSKAGSGTYVAESVPDTLLNTVTLAPLVSQTPAKSVLSVRGKHLLERASASARQWGPFMPGVPDVTAFPHKLFSRYLTRLNRDPMPSQLTYNSHPGGEKTLQQALVEYLRVSRSVHCRPEQILITEGIHQALDLVTRMLCNPGDYAWVEEPGYWGIRNILQMNDVNICPIPVDESGMVPPDELLTAPPRLIFVTPSHQYPLGSVMSLPRRQQLLAIARKLGSWLIEDDYDSEFRFSGHPIPSLQGLETETPVIYIGTFSKTLYPGLRLGYVVLPETLVMPLVTAHGELYRAGHLLTQRALAQFIDDGHYSAHIRRMRLLYAKRRSFLTALIEQHLGKDALHPFTSNAGLHLILRLPENIDDIAIAADANQQGVMVRPLSRYYLGSQKSCGLLMGFASLPEQEMAEAFSILMQCIHQHQPSIPALNQDECNDTNS
ncbi:MAG: PLP-dependent aminotransferase family protein [Pantoea sp.]|uniref:MocR-like pyridoxine biosynthesis transcription factor PdxR n=1 Tax=Pantoea sp. TaxID=69393 RepID=UPI0023A41480|nr:PLP-dependent aminotransferase family protein [Pantoea sp.]MDE1185438.1 PLP-dependent aminotransferase family protein [Pantoea sp.]